MRSRRKLGLVLIGALAIILLVTLWPADEGPVHNGKSLSEWLDLRQRATGYDSTRDSSYNPAVLQESEDAVLAIGTNALPSLLKWTQDYSGESRWRYMLGRLADELPVPLGESRVVSWFTADRAFDRARLAAAGFDILGTNAVAALPQLKRLIKDRRSPASAEAALCVVPYIGPDGIPVLLETLSDSNDPMRATAASLFNCASCLGTNRGITVRLLSECVADSDLRLAVCAAESLGDLAIEPEICTPALIGGLQDARHELRSVCARSLGCFGESSRAAVPALTAALEDKYWNVRSAVTNALRKIAPKLLEAPPPQNHKTVTD